NLGARWDLQTARNLASDAPANDAFPNLLPALQYQGQDDNAITWNDLSPRLGLSYALDEARRTVVRASFARYATHLSFGNVTTENPVSAGILAYGWNDRNGDRMVQANEVDLGNFLYSVNVDPANPAAIGSTVSVIDRDLRAKHDNEAILGIDREVAANFAVGAAFTYRRSTDWDYRPLLAGPCTGEPSRQSCAIIGPEQYAPNTA